MNQSKELLRRTMKERRRSLRSEEHDARSREISTQVIACLAGRLDNGMPGPLGVPVLLSFMPMKYEVNISPVNEWAWNEQITLLMPRVDRQKRRLTLHEVRSPGDMSEGAYGICEPHAGTIEWPETEPIGAVLVPGLAFDGDGGRLGYGGGYYDKLLAQLHAVGLFPNTIAPAFELQLIERVPIDLHDVLVDVIITESGVKRRKIQKDS